MLKSKQEEHNLDITMFFGDNIFSSQYTCVFLLESMRYLD